VKINTPLPAVGGTPDASRARSTGSPAAQAKPHAGSGERVDISSLSARLAEVGAGEAPVNAQKVAEIKQAIAEGRFQINPERIADGLLGSVREMLIRASKTV